MKIAGQQIKNLRSSNLMTKIMMRDEQAIINHVVQEQIQINKPLNQMGDTVTHYAAYKALYKLLEFLMSKKASLDARNHRGLTPIDVASPEVRQWLYEKQSKTQTITKNEKKSLNQNQSLDALNNLLH